MLIQETEKLAAFSDHFARTDAPTWYDVVQDDAHRATIVVSYLRHKLDPCC